MHVVYRLCQHLAYEYARKGARLALIARREDRLCVVADESRRLGSPDVVVIPADVSKLEDCKRFIDKAVNYFGRCKCIYIYVCISAHFYAWVYGWYLNCNLRWRFHGLIYATVDHLASNAAIVKLGLFEDVTQISEFAPTMVRFSFQHLSFFQKKDWAWCTQR